MSIAPARECKPNLSPWGIEDDIDSHKNPESYLEIMRKHKQRG